MAVINILSPHVADLIAAGEVVERPASVIKELIENSFDAGAKNIICEIRSGGTTYIRITDDGCGMSPEDAGIAFTRHATSKLADESGLEHISTMGFRGEALAAISSVSRTELITRLRGTAEGTRVTLDAGDIVDMSLFGCPEGTTMIIRDLFYNTPARQKFMKSDRSEASACISAATRCAMARPDVSLRMIRDGKEEFFTPGDGRIDSCLYSLLGREEAVSMLPCTSTSDSFSLNGFTSSPADCRGNRAHQFFFVNGRFVKSQLLQTALEQAYKNTLLTGRYPACVLYLKVPFGAVDVNVHPAKTEVRFGSEKAVFDFVYNSVRFSLEGEDRLAARSAVPSPDAAQEIHSGVSAASPVPDISVNPSPDAVVSTCADTVMNISQDTAVHASHDTAVNTSPDVSADRNSEAPVSGNTGTAAYMNASSAAYINSGRSSFRVSGSGLQSGPAAGSGTVFAPDLFEEAVRLPSFSAVSASHSDSVSHSDSASHTDAEDPSPCAELSGGKGPDCAFVENFVQNVENQSVQVYKILGEAFKTYIIVEQKSEIILIDKHAAHERMIFDRLRMRKTEPESQLLLAPETIHVSHEDAELIENNAELFAGLGYEIDPYGEKDFIIRGIPADMAPGDAAASVEEICEKFRNGISPDPAAVRDEILHTVACKAAIKAGWDTTAQELDVLVRGVLSGAVKYCPHGRPVSVSVSRADLDRLFKRIV